MNRPYNHLEPINNHLPLYCLSGDVSKMRIKSREQWPPHCGKQQFTYPPKTTYKKESIMKKQKLHLFNTILWFVISGIWLITFVGRLITGTDSFFLMFITGFTLLASLACAILNLCNYLKEKNHPSDDPNDTLNET